MKALPLFIVTYLFIVTTVSYAQIDLDRIKDIPNAVMLKDDIIGGGKPSEKALLKLKEMGIKAVIDLRTAREGTEEEEQFIKEIGLNYYNIPIGSIFIRKRQVEDLASIIEAENNRPAIIHCASGSRVFALWDKYLQSQTP